MIGKEKLFKKLEVVLDKSDADQTEIVVSATQSGLTRFANSYIHQNVYENNNSITFRSVIGKQVGVAQTNSMVKADLEKALRDSIEIAKQQPENPNFPGLPDPAKYKDLDTYDEATAKFTAAGRAKLVKKIIGASSRKKFTVAGALSTSATEIAVLNSKGVRAYQPVTAATVNMIPMSDTSSGYAAGTSRRIGDLDIESMARTAVEKCDMSQNPRQVEPGKYEVILEPSAVAELLEWLSYIGFGSKPFMQKMSFLSGKIGRKITSDKISIYDNGLDTRAVAFPFDFEGVPKKRVDFVKNGQARGVVYDRASALKAKTRSTGHAVPAAYASEGASGVNIFMGPGKVKREKMIQGVKKGILVTRFHYINGFIDPRNSVLTGMTRDGTFLIENGEIQCGIKNLRFTDSMMRAFGTTVAVSKERECKDSWWSAVGCMTVPALHLKKLNFSGKTDF